MPSPVQAPDLSSPQAGLWLTLAHAFLPAMDRDTAQAFLGVLSQDLRELCADVGLRDASEIAAFEHALAALPDPSALLEHYSRLFLVPCAGASLNLGCYLEGMLPGDGQQLIDAILARHGAQRREDFRGLSDHLAALLELMVLLSAEGGAQADGHMLARKVLLPGLAGLERDVARAEPGSPYRALAALARRAVEAGLPARGEEPAPPHGADGDTASETGAWYACRVCGNPYAREKDLALLRHVLAAHGLPADHLDTCPACRNPADADRCASEVSGECAQKSCR